ncbi:MAG: amidase [Cyanobacteria bacterium J06648_16]
MQYLTATAALATIQRREQVPSQLIETYLARIEQREPTVQAWAHLALASAREQAIGYDQRQRDYLPDTLSIEKPLWGIPVGIKDIFATIDMPTGWGFPLYSGRYLSEEADVVSRLKAAGAIILGKTVTTELATAAAGTTGNPHNLDYSPGGSSSGSAAAVADGMVPIAIGSQTMGSILRPAAYCGIFGFKPSFGLISRAGMMPVSVDLDHVGIFATCLDDIRLVFEQLLDPGALLSSREDIIGSQLISSPRIAWIKTPHWHLVEPMAQACLQQAVDALSQAGATVRAVELPTRCTDYWETTQILCAYGLYQHHGGLLKQHLPLCSPQLKDWMLRGQHINASEYANALHKKEQYRADIDNILNHFDVILTPVTSGPAPMGREQTGSPLFCSLWSLCGLPALNIPAGKTANGLPLGCQLVDQRNHDRQLFQIAQYCWQHIKSRFGGIQVPGK